MSFCIIFVKVWNLLIKYESLHTLSVLFLWNCRNITHSSKFKQKGLNLLTLIHLRCFFVNEKSIYWLLVFKIFGLKIWTCNFLTNIMSVFSESQIVTGTISSTGMRSRTQDIRQRATKKGFQWSTDRRIFTGNGWVNIPVGNYNWEDIFLNLNKS